MTVTNDRLQHDFVDRLQVEGVNFKGFGIIPKFVMQDPDLSITAKAIYAYFCSFSGNGDSAFPGRSKILNDLLISKNAYYKHFGLLKDQGYILVQQSRLNGAVFSNNIYTLVSNPKKFCESFKDKKQSLAYNRIRFSGLKSAGYGIIPKAVMLDSRLDIKAKGIYAYFCSLSGSGNNAFPSRKAIVKHLKISENTFYKYITLLIDLNYMYSVQRRIDGKFSVNDYYLCDNPYMGDNSSSEVLEHKSPCLKKWDTEKWDTKKWDTKKEDTNINSININNIKYNHSLKKGPASPKKDEGVSDKTINEKVFSELAKARTLPYSFASDKSLMKSAIKIMAGWDSYIDSFDDPLDKKVYTLFIEALIDMCMSEKMTLKGSYVDYSMVIDKINQYAVFEKNAQGFNVMLTEFPDLARENFKAALLDREISNPLQYMKACIWDSMLTGNLKKFSDTGVKENKKESKKTWPIKKELNFNAFPQHSYTDEELNSLFEDIEDL